MSEKINEFLNSNIKLEFNILKKELYYDTAHLSTPHQMSETDSYKKLVTYGDKIVPIIMNEIINGDPLWALFSIVTEIIGDENIQPEYGGESSRKRFSIWWDINKHKYGE